MRQKERKVSCIDEDGNWDELDNSDELEELTQLEQDEREYNIHDFYA